MNFTSFAEAKLWGPILKFCLKFRPWLEGVWGWGWRSKASNLDFWPPIRTKLYTVTEIYCDNFFPSPAGSKSGFLSDSHCRDNLVELLEVKLTKAINERWHESTKCATKEGGEKGQKDTGRNSVIQVTERKGNKVWLHLRVETWMIFVS